MKLIRSAEIQPSSIHCLNSPIFPCLLYRPASVTSLLCDVLDNDGDDDKDKDGDADDDTPASGEIDADL